MDMLSGMSPLSAAALYVALLTFQLVSLKGYVSSQRYRHKAASGDYSNPDFARAARVQANAVEDIPPLMIGLVLLALMGAPAVNIHAIGMLLVVSRILHAVGLATAGGKGIGRLLGTAGTMFVYLIIAVALVVRAFWPA